MPVIFHFLFCELAYYFCRIAKCHGIVRDYHFPVTSAPAPMMQFFPTTAPLSIMLPIPTTVLSPTVQPCTTALCPMDTPFPIWMECPSSVCSVLLSCTLELSSIKYFPYRHAPLRYTRFLHSLLKLHPRQHVRPGQDMYVCSYSFHSLTF